MGFSEISLKTYSTELSSVAFVSGGSVALALTLNQGINLLARVCHLTLGNEKYAIHEPLILELLPRMGEMREILLDFMDREASPKGKSLFVHGEASPLEQQNLEIQGKAKASLELMSYSLEGLQICDRLLGYSNPEGTANLGIGIQLFRSTLEGAWLHLLALLPQVEEELYVKHLKESGEKMIQEGQGIFVGLSRDVLLELGGG